MKYVFLHFGRKISYLHAKIFWQPHADLIAWFEMESVYRVLFSKNSKSLKITNPASIVMKIVAIEGLWLLYWCTKFHIDISSRWYFIGVWNIKNRTHTHTCTHAHTRTHVHTHTHAHTHASGRQLKMTFLDILDYSEYSDTNISIFFFTKHSFLSQKEKWTKCG